MCVCVCVCVCVSVCVCVCVFVCVLVCLSVCVYIFILTVLMEISWNTLIIIARIKFLTHTHIYIYIYIYKRRHLLIKGWAFETRGQVHLPRKQRLSSTENDINMQLAKTWTALNSLSVIWKSDLTNKIKHIFF